MGIAPFEPDIKMNKSAKTKSKTFSYLLTAHQFVQANKFSKAMYKIKHIAFNKWEVTWKIH